MSKQTAIAAALLLAILGSAGFIAAYATGGNRLYEGIGIAVAASGLAAAALGWAFWIIPGEIVVDEIETYPSPAEERAVENAIVSHDVRVVTRPRLLVALLGASVASFVAALAVPFRSLGPAPDSTLFHTRWRRGQALAREDGRVLRVDDLNVDSTLTIFPQSAIGDAQSAATLIRLPADSEGTASGYVAYSRLCTHAGCPVALYRAAARQLLCPCHQSVFDVVSDGAVIAGPADHALPRLPIEVGSDGVLRATGDFPDPVGPSFWERG
ncbi:MAG TPA: Rieske 2Fe-2S domain-containing protein [Candidatus Baltobacteraceae bacterium]|jgi:ubiquinol-cytochrome c reductase iron-sulfur subunit|nr:Rieske 2Fe-2S domain-containing protein [Candidatus Baltobacteraceae bacterium]